MTTREVVLLGSTGSIGTQAIDVIRREPGRFRVVAIAGGGGRPEELAAQAIELGVEAVAVSRATAAQDVQLALYAAAKRSGHDRGDFVMPKVLAGPDAVTEVAAWPCDIVLNGITGSVGLHATLAALEAGRTLALANKESLIAGGPLVVPYLDRIIPVDSEHSALAQCLRGGAKSEVRRLVLTASGGPFRGKARADLAHVTPSQAMAHPTWDMGPVITVNSATLVNKGLEIIEAHLLFDIPYERIDVVVHPQSLVHSMVEFADGSTIAQLSPPDMRLPIALALGWPDRVGDAAPGMDWTAAQSLTFEPLDTEAFPAVDLAKAAGQVGGSGPAVFNAANEEAVAAFLDGRLPFLAIVEVIQQTLSRVALRELSTPADVLESEDEARRLARALISQLSTQET
ncbi:MAG TPA: 1-deoxy-D-xylulose-5-phosphate reductoisomerase [Frankiaceae bacterium]|nr:1-deoxy-D-xylulose-5-phosphate reductoisomerase [Frankiaceae bacterium]